MNVGTTIEMRVIVDNGEPIVMVLETWRAFKAADLPICMVPRGRPPLPGDFQRTVPMYRSEAIEKGLLKA